MHLNIGADFTQVIGILLVRIHVVVIVIAERWVIHGLLCLDCEPEWISTRINHTNVVASQEHCARVKIIR